MTIQTQGIDDRLDFNTVRKLVVFMDEFFRKYFRLTGPGEVFLLNLIDFDTPNAVPPATHLIQLSMNFERSDTQNEGDIEYSLYLICLMFESITQNKVTVRQSIFNGSRNHHQVNISVVITRTPLNMRTDFNDIGKNVHEFIYNHFLQTLSRYSGILAKAVNNPEWFKDHSMKEQMTEKKISVLNYAISILSNTL